MWLGIKVFVVAKARRAGNRQWWEGEMVTIMEKKLVALPKI